MSGRFPDAENLDDYWSNLAAGRVSITDVPRQRWDVDRVFDPDRLAPGRTYSRWAALLPDVERFDERFFNLSPLDAGSMDPQQRLFLRDRVARRSRTPAAPPTRGREPALGRLRRLRRR